MISITLVNKIDAISPGEIDEFNLESEIIHLCSSKNIYRTDATNCVHVFLWLPLSLLLCMCVCMFVWVDDWVCLRFWCFRSWETPTVKRSWESEGKKKWRCQMKTWRRTPVKRFEWIIQVWTVLFGVYELCCELTWCTLLIALVLLESHLSHHI